MQKLKQKEPVSLRIAKITLVIAVITGLGTIIFGGGAMIMKYYNGEVNNETVKPVSQETYYQKLTKDCEKFKKSKSITDYDCCLQTVEIMEKGNFKLAPKNGCLDGFQINSLWCSGAYSWCEPMKEAEIDLMFYCDSKKDCAVVNFDCGLCECDLRAINKNYKNEVCKNFTGEYCDRVCKGVNYKCVNNRCEIAR